MIHPLLQTNTLFTRYSVEQILIEFRKLVDEGYLTERAHPEYSQLRIFNYTDKCTFDKVWSPLTLSCRGLVLCTNLKKIIAVGLPKFFNVGEQGVTLADLPQSGYVLEEKLDGSNIICFYYEPASAWLCATRGSFHSEQAGYAQQILDEILKTDQILNKNLIYNFELIHPNNRIVLNYGETKGLVLLDCFQVGTFSRGRYPFNGRWHPLISYPAQYLGPSSLEELPNFVEQLKGKEGVVLKYNSGYRVKLKTSEYCALHKAKFGLTPLSLWEAMMEDKLEEYMAAVPEEFRGEAEIYKSKLSNKIDQIFQDCVAWLLADNKNLLSRKELAAQLESHGFPYKGIIWGLYGGMEHHIVRKNILKMVRPDGNIL